MTTTPSERPAFERMHGRDSGFLVFERPGLPMQIAGLLVFEAAPLRTASGSLDEALIRHHIRSRLERVPRYLQRVVRSPLLGTPFWADDPDFDIARHVRFIRCPAPGGISELQGMMRDILPRPLDRSMPLWECWFIDGIEGDRVAVFMKVHHCLGDGRAGTELIRHLLLPVPRTEAATTPARLAVPLPTGAVLLRTEATRWLRAPLRLGAALRRLATSGDVARAAAAKARALLATLVLTVRVTSRTPLNQRVQSERHLSWTAFDGERLRRIRAHSGASLHEVSLAILAGALRRAFLERGPLPRLRAMAPTSGLTKAELGVLGNRVHAPLVDLPLDAPDPRERLRRIRETHARLTRDRQGLGWDVMMEATDWLGARAQAFSMWVATRLRAYNIVLTLVPGPRYPVYLLGARLLTIYPVLPLLDGQTITVGLLAYEDRLHWGIVSTPEYAEAFSDLVPLLHASLAELEAAYGGIDPEGTVRLEQPSPVPLSRVTPSDA